ncbi:hypothetical protein [Methylosinus sp. LW3]|uniref:hypothetical protein n=1 Tax=Methylosinus sp. LW3 TaxID=107635 RepID=UPI0018DD79F1|nr:hypothetical protein [Methylosinus sp. LW3]
MPAIEGELGDRRDEDRGGVVVAVEHIGFSASTIRISAARGRDRCGQRPSWRMRHERQASSKRFHQSAGVGCARRVCLIDVARIPVSKIKYPSGRNQARGPGRLSNGRRLLVFGGDDNRRWRARLERPAKGELHDPRGWLVEDPGFQRREAEQADQQR